MKNDLTRMTLIQRIKNRIDQSSWEEFVYWYSPYINTIIHRSGVPFDHVEDLCQEVLLKIWKSIENFEYDPTKCRFRSWLSTVCRNHILTFYSNQKKKYNHVDIEETCVPLGEAEINEIIETEWQLYIAGKALEKVKDNFNDKAFAAYKSFQQGVDVVTIADELGVAENTVYVYSKRVKEAMTREILLLVKDLD